MPYLVNFEQIFYKIERHFGLKDTPNHLELKFMGKNNKKPFGLKIQSTTSDQLHPIPFKSLKKACFDLRNFFALFSRKIKIDASEMDCLI